MTTTTTLESALDQSIRDNRIVHLPFERELAEELVVLSDDHVINGSQMEFWAAGDDDDGGAWRVHLDLANQADVLAAAEVSLGI